MQGLFQQRRTRDARWQPKVGNGVQSAGPQQRIVKGPGPIGGAHEEQAGRPRFDVAVDRCIAFAGQLPATLMAETAPSASATEAL